jgi:hypothetical protein
MTAKAVLILTTEATQNRNGDLGDFHGNVGLGDFHGNTL